MKFKEMIQKTWYLAKTRSYNNSKQHLTPLPGGILDPQLAAFILIGNDLQKDYKNHSVAEVRANHMLNMVLYRKFSGPVAQIPNVWNSSIPNLAGEIPIRCYMPAGEGPFPIFVYYHGGGWVLGNLNLADNFARSLCYYGKMSVISVDYRLAPEHPFPAGFDDAYHAYLWAGDPQNAKEFRGDLTKLIVGGDSAGGNLAAAVSLKAREESGPRIAQQVLIYPATNLAEMETDSYQLNQNDPLLPSENINWFLEQYLSDEHQKFDPFVSPALAESHAGLPPATVLVAEYDPLCDDGEEYANLLSEAGVDVELIRANGLSHGFISLRELVKRADWYTQLLMNTINDRL
ncbi:MAG: alpha/beta hydrolase [Anaerolineae bacterium]|jgi:acetyl esterase|nr:alpha/beta hydrolase [Anaerolineae bacterium]